MHRLLSCGSQRATARAATAHVATALLLCAGASSAAHAQSPRTTVTNYNTWYSWIGDNAITDRWAITSDVFLRRQHGGAAPQQTLLRPGVLYQLAPNVRIGGGYAYIATWPYGDDPIAARVPEHRFWEQLSLTHRAGRVGFLHRYRYEQRRIGVGDPADPSRIVRYRNENRLRYFARGIHDLGRSTGPFLQIHDEIFVTAGPSSRVSLLDQNRFFVGGGYRFSPTLRLEVGYLEQRIWKASGLRAERNHTLSVTLLSTAALR